MGVHQEAPLHLTLFSFLSLTSELPVLNLCTFLIMMPTSLGFFGVVLGWHPGPCPCQEHPTTEPHSATQDFPPDSPVSPTSSDH